MIVIPEFPKGISGTGLCSVDQALARLKAGLTMEGGVGLTMESGVLHDFPSAVMPFSAAAAIAEPPRLPKSVM